MVDDNLMRFFQSDGGGDKLQKNKMQNTKNNMQNTKTKRYKNKMQKYKIQ